MKHFIVIVNLFFSTVFVNHLILLTFSWGGEL
jgi:hypothetical protein